MEDYYFSQIEEEFSEIGMDRIIKDYKELIDDHQNNENSVQKYLEENSELIPLPILLNHGLHFNSIISKFPLDTSLITDFVYITKSTDSWYVVLVELEDPRKRLFVESYDLVAEYMDFKNALAQVKSWREFLRRNEESVIRKLKPLLLPHAENPVYFKYVLIIGRRDEIENNQARLDRISSISNEENIRILTFDSLISSYETNPPKNKRNVLKLKRNYYEYKYLHELPFSIFAYVVPEHLHLRAEQKAYLIKNEYNIHAWEKGEFLIYDGKLTRAESFGDS